MAALSGDREELTTLPPPSYPRLNTLGRAGGERQSIHRVAHPGERLAFHEKKATNETK